jgi:YfiH family protein
VLSEVRRSPQGPYLDVSHLFPEDVFAYVTLRGFEDVGPFGLARVLAARGNEGVRVHRLDQVHSGRVATVKEAPCPADALLSSKPGEAVRVVAADCVPVLLAQRDGPGVAAVHAGWKGTLARIVESAAERLRERCSGNLVAYVGPSIGPCCYTVERDRHTLFAKAFPTWAGEAGDRPALDLGGINVRLLLSAGVEPACIHVEERCTACGDGLCCSYRRDGERAGRMAALIGRRP